MSSSEDMKDSARDRAVHPEASTSGRETTDERQQLELERAACERRLEQLTAHLNTNAHDLVQSRQSVEQTAQARADFLIGICPELRTPLHDLLGNTTLLRHEDGLTDRQRSRLDAVMEAGIRLLERLNCLLTLSSDTVSAAPIVESAVADAAPTATVRHLRVLLVDDLAMNRDIAAAFLAAEGHHVAIAQHGAMAVKMATEQDFDVVLMDVRMSGMDGLEATRRIRALKSSRGKVPIIALTALAFTEQVEKCREAGMNGHLAKPFSPETLCRAAMMAAARREEEKKAESAALPVPVVDFASFKRVTLDPSESRGAGLRSAVRQPAAEPASQHSLTAQPWIDIASPWSPPASAMALIGGTLSSRHVDNNAFILRLASVSVKSSHHLLDKKLSCEPPPENNHFEFHWLLFATPSSERHHGFSANCDLWRWSATNWRSITVPGANFSPEELHDQGWRYCGPCVERRAQVEILPEPPTETTQ